MRRRVERCALTPLSKNGCGKTTLVIEATRRGPASGVRPTHTAKSGQTPSTALRSPPPALPPSCAATQASVADAAVQAHLAVTEAASGIGVVALREIAIRRVEDEVDLAAFGVDTFATRVKKPCAAGGEREAGRRSSSVRSEIHERQQLVTKFGARPPPL